MKKYEFKVVELYAIANEEKWEEQLNALSEDGWQLAGAVMAQGSPRAILQRRIKK